MTIWGFFSQSLSRAGSSVIGDEKLITKVYFPRMVIPLAVIASAGFDFVVAFGLLLIVAFFYGYPPGLTLLAVIPAILIAFFASAGIGAALAAWTVRYRDFRYIVPFFLQFAMYLAPIVYSKSMFSPRIAFLASFNPMTGACDLFRFGITGKPPVDLIEIAASAAISMALFVFGGFAFRQVEQSFADTI